MVPHGTVGVSEEGGREGEKWSGIPCQFDFSHKEKIGRERRTQERGHLKK